MKKQKTVFNPKLWQKLSFKFASLVLGCFLGLAILFYFYCPVRTDAASTYDLKKDLGKQLEDIQQQINIYRSQIKQKQQEAISLSREISILDDQISQAELEIKQTEIASQRLEIMIAEKEKEISEFSEAAGQKKRILSEYLRIIYEYDQKSLSEILLQTQNFSDFFDEIQSLEVIQDQIKDEVVVLRSLQEELEKQKAQVEEEKGQYDELKRLQELQKKSSQIQQDRKRTLLGQTKGQEGVFEKLMDRAYSDIASVRNQLYLLEGVGLSMPLEEALRRAEIASSKTGVRPAFLLAVLKKESSWGTNVGTGYWRSDMHPRDHEAYLEICRKLGVSPDQMPVSRKPSYGWGGAMGPAQFLPSTWLGLESEIARATGHNPPNPWDVDDAFVAAGLKLVKNGAGVKSYDAEWKAAMIYFAGSRWNNSLYRFYGDSVMELANVIQKEIDVMKGN